MVFAQTAPPRRGFTLIELLVVMGIIAAFQVFTSAFVLFGATSGPDESALFYSFYLYRKAFEQFQVGYGSALAWILFICLSVFTFVQFRASRSWVFYSGEVR